MKKNRFKAFFINISLGLIIGLLISIVGGAIVITFMEKFVDKLLSDLVFATGIMAFGTIILAIASFWTIRQNYKFREKDRRERLLNEIIEWATDIAKCGLEKDLPDTSHITDVNDGKLHLAYSTNILAKSFQSMRGRNQYIRQIVLIFGKDLQEATKNIITPKTS